MTRHSVSLKEFFALKRECFRCFRYSSFELIFSHLIVAQTAIDLLMHVYLHFVNVLRRKRRVSKLKLSRISTFDLFFNHALYIDTTHIDFDKISLIIEV